MHSSMWQYDFMHIASENILRILMDIEGGNQSAMHRRTGITQPTIGRITKGTVMPDLANIEKVAQAYGFDTWQLLVKGFDPKHPPVLRYMSGAEESLYLKFKMLQQEMVEIHKA